jgi:hypothetical protein
VFRSDLLATTTQVDQWNIVLTNRCNLHCITCSYPDQRPFRFVRRETILRHLPRLLDLGLSRAMLTGGEPTMHPEFDEILQDLYDAGLDVTLVTNGTYIRKHLDAIAGRLDRLIISMDGDTPELYEEIRGAPAFRLLLTLPALVRERSPDTHQTICIVVQRKNFRRLPEFLELGCSLGVDRVSFLAPDLAGMVAPLERGGAFGHLEVVSEQGIDAVALTLDEVRELREEVLPRLYETAARHPGATNNSIPMVETYADHFEAFRQRRPRGDLRRCALPFREVVLDELERFRFCFFMPDAWPAADVDDPANHPGIVAARQDYLDRDARATRFCDMCVQAARVEDAS